MIRKLQTRFIAIAMLSVFIVLLILIGMINVMNYVSMTREADYTVSLIFENDGLIPANLPKDNHIEDFSERQQRRNLSPELAYQSRYFIVKYNENGEKIFSDLKRIASLNETEAIELANEILSSGRQQGYEQHYRFLKRTEDSTTTLVFLNCYSEISTFQNSLYLSALISFIGIIAVFLLILLLSRRIIRPISESYEKQKQFITDAGHELKTPITIINADADVLESDLNESNEWIEDIHKQTRRLSQLTNDLIYLSKMQEDGVKLLRTDFSISDLVNETAQSFYAVALSQNKKFASAVQPDLFMIGDEKAITKLVTILLDNAIKYSTDNGIIRLILKKESKQLLLSVFNTADNIEKGNADRLFDRFYRTDSSRNSETGGFGLGLSVAKAVVEAHKGKIHAYSSDGQSLTVDVIFPL